MRLLALLGSILSVALSVTTGCTPAPAEPASPAAPAQEGGAVWGANYFPNVPLVSHRGEKVRFFDLIRGKVVAINFIYTKCTDSCPMETARMVEVQKLLGDRVGKDVFFFSISIDPEHDTPERLAKYAQMWKTGPGWTFLTGSDEDVTFLRKKLGVYEPDRKKKDHGLSLVIGNQQTGRWMKRSPFENPYVLATQLGSWLHNWKLKGAADRDYANAPEVRNISTGEELFRTRCAACHSVGGTDRGEHDAHAVGPDLTNVEARRTRAWLTRWMMQPDRMIADKDPTALALLAQYGGVVMPNFRMSEAEVADVLGYLRDESARSAGEGVVVSTVPLDVGTRPRTRTPSSLTAARTALDAYESVRARLAADDLAGAKASAGSRDLPRALGSAAQEVAGAADLDAARGAFGALSKAVLQLLSAHPSLRAGRHLFECPMAPGYRKWVQTSADAENPYWGSRMLHCGRRLAEWTSERGPI